MVRSMCFAGTVKVQYTEWSTLKKRLSEYPRTGIIARSEARSEMAGRIAERRQRVTRGTGNVFADLGFPDAVERQAKLHLAYVLNQVLDGRKLSQADAAKVLGVTQPKVSALRHYKLAGYSVERLMNLLTALDHDVEIVIRRKPRSRKSARITVVAEQMALKPKATPRQRRSFTSARRRAVARLRKGLDLQWTPPASRDALHDRGQGSRRRGR
jgi:predicted XRE-type DNA-binding protein